MGVPAFFRWLSRKYVSIIVDANEQRPQEVNGVKIPVDCTKPNQNFQEFDNLYLDMNGIIHPCTHPEDRPAPKTEEEMFILIFEYIDRLFSIVRPRKLLYMAVDGVAPRAKMNQQRSRRFRASKEAADKREQIANIRKKLESEGVPLPPPRKEEDHFDSNCITPGTPFMARLSHALRYYVHMKITNDPAWQNIQVILSDANVPGEGEHKIMDYIRRQRASQSHDPNTVHCLCGADADLIMLGLATHEANFNILREEFVPNQPKPCELCGQYGHELEHCEGLARADTGPDQADPLKKEKNFIFIRLPILREYLERELVMPNLPFPFDLERAIDDWVMMCFFVGNDFLPHLPSLEIRENAIDRLVKLYKNMVYQTGGWLTEDGEINIERVKIIMIELGKVEDQIFKDRQLRELRFKESQKQRKKRAKETAALIMPYNASLIAPEAVGSRRQHYSGKEIREMAAEDRQQMERQSQKLKSLLTPVAAQTTSNTSIGSKRKATGNTSDSSNGAPPAKDNSPPQKDDEDKSAADKPKIIVRTPSGKPTPLAKGAIGALVMDQDESDEEPEDEIRFWEAGWKSRYYRAKFQVSESDKEFRKKVACAYVEGLAWVLRYYYQGCASWTWFFPYHYAPFASDFDLIDDFQPDFTKKTVPFKPLEQLMGVFPAASRAHIPETWRWLMTDSKSPIIDFYPEDFEIDLNGKKFAWQGVALLPFVDEKRLLDALNTVYDTLTEEEKARNMIGPDRLFVGKKHGLFELLNEIHQHGKENGNTNTAIADTDSKGQQTIGEVKEGGEEELKEGENNNEPTKKGEGDNEEQSEEVIMEVQKQWVDIDESKAFGMSGQVAYDNKALAYGVSHVSLFRNSLEFGDIKNNSCIMVEFRDPQFPLHFRFKATRLDGIKELPRVLKPRDYDDRRQGPFRPQIGFSRDIPRASLSSTGHRTLNHHIDQYQRRSDPTSSHFHYSNQPQPLSNQLPWHTISAPRHQSTSAQHEQFPMAMNNGMTPPPLFSFSQMAMPPPPLPPQNWITPLSAHGGGGGGYIGQWGQPPQHVQPNNPNPWHQQRNNSERERDRRSYPQHGNHYQQQQGGNSSQSRQHNSQHHSAPREFRSSNYRRN